MNEPYNCHLLWPDGKRNAKFGSKIFQTPTMASVSLESSARRFLAAHAP